METPLETGYPLDARHEQDRHLDAPLLRLDLAHELEELRASDSFERAGHHGKTIVKHPDLRVVLIAFQAGGRILEHQTPERISIQTLEGHVRVRSGGQEVDLPKGCLLAIDRNVPHEVQADEDSAVLLTLSWAGRPPRGP